MTLIRTLGMGDNSYFRHDNQNYGCSQLHDDFHDEQDDYDISCQFTSWGSVPAVSYASVERVYD